MPGWESERAFRLGGSIALAQKLCAASVESLRLGADVLGCGIQDSNGGCRWSGSRRRMTTHGGVLWSW
jgi:hypothetical protein